MPIYLKKPPRGARRNMAIRYGGAEWDTWGEVPAEIKKLILGGAAPPSPPRQVRASTGLFERQETQKGKRRGRKARRYEPKPAGTPLSHSQAKTIGSSIGGMAAYCAQQEGESHKDALTRVSGGQLDHPTASAVIDALKDEGVDLYFLSGRKPDDEEARIAQAILADVGGVVCTPPTRKNRNFSW